MISYEPLWQIMKDKNISQYALTHKYGISARTVNTLKHNKGITMDTLNKLCNILECTPHDILRYEKDD